MNIGEAAKKSGLTPKMIRYYESIELLRPAGRSASGYRHYNEEVVDKFKEFLDEVTPDDFAQGNS